MKNPIDILKEDHAHIEELFKNYEDLASDAFDTKRKLAEKIGREIRVHAGMEERLFYPAARKTLLDAEQEIMEESFVEHDVAKRLIEEISVTHPEDPQFDARIKVLNETIAHHIKEEETELLPRVDSLLGDDDRKILGEDMEKWKREHGHV